MSLHDTLNTGSGWIGFFAQSVGASEAAFKLLVSLVLGYPLAYFHRQYLFGSKPIYQHLFFIVCGLIIGYFNYGPAILHSFTCILTTYLLLVTCGGTVFTIAVAFTFLMSYLLASYYYTGTENYDITWSMPHCVLTLRLIGLVMDVYDGQQKTETLSIDQKKNALQKVPSLFEISAHTYFFGGFLVGPQFSMRRYLDFVNGAFADRSGGKPACVMPGIARLSLGVMYMTIFHVGSLLMSERFVLSHAYNLMPFWKKTIVIALWGKITLYKYIASWLLAEGSCILSGLTYNGRDENGNDLWDGCCNVKVWSYETEATFDKLIKTFNVNTNLWVAHYIFKRLKFLGNKLLSQALSLVFLAVWHGLHSGYYMTFFMEFIVMKMERDFQIVAKRSPLLQAVNNSSALQIPLYIFLKFFQLFMFGYCVVPFVLLSVDRWWQVYSSLYFAGFVFYLGWPFAQPFIKSLLCSPRPKEPRKEEMVKEVEDAGKEKASQVAEEKTNGATL